jgi:hypothetical protein
MQEPVDEVGIEEDLEDVGPPLIGVLLFLLRPGRPSLERARNSESP